ncbi:serine hydrolase domain-containing protein [Kutzneria sp. CA-103260]|uniref:serine hydrolase domain-containing protein n=1 Tax=Kutzneria sp. CA-103260 TaxID=2802641 RepID=UPI001BAAFA63|nr:serine hydrolase domain-containing protein [Kutzneria sp. CA-103260]QUQ66937.1 serine hydrolase [Kutzneria sp. CA-103260]
MSLSSKGLTRLRDTLARHVDNGECPGLVSVIRRRGETHVDVIGDVRRDTIFRIASMTKPVTAALAMALVEQGRLRLDDPVDELLPELADRRVLTSLDAEVDDTVPANRAITLRDLLTFRLGWGGIYAPPGTYPVQAAAAELQLGLGEGPPRPAGPPEPDEWMRRFGTLPLLHQPGERWMYHTGSEVLGVLLARATGRSLGEAMREHLFEPLGMIDTGFHVPEAQLGRLTVSYSDGKLFDAVDGQWSKPPAFEAGGGGLVSTADDYLAFATMLLANGKHGRERVLSRPAVRLMTTDHLTPGQHAADGFWPGFFGAHRGWGFGVQVVTGRDELWATPGRYGWDGGLGTSWHNDPAEDLTAILLTQRAGFLLHWPLYLDFWNGVYASLDD